VVSVNGLTGAVTISTSGGGGPASIGTKSPSSNPSNDYDAGTTDVVRVDPTTGLTITGLAGGVSGVVKLLVNVSTHNVLLSSSNTNSNSTNRFLFTGSDRVLSENDSASTFYDSTSQRWRLIADEPAAPPYHWATVTATSTLNNYSPGTATVLRVVASGGSRFISGFSGGGPNKALRVINISTNNLTLYHESSSSDAANRLLLDAGTDRALQENDQAELLYDPISSRWRVTPCCGVSS
jgi:predicted DCC family thiol-disulfide oxidoreductase YuxK